MTIEGGLDPDERALRDHLQSTRFQGGVDGGRWRLQSLSWPIAMIAIAAAPRNSAPDEYLLRFDLDGYPQRGPTATPWDGGANCLLPEDRRPKGERASHIFRTDWEEGQALYAPWDRVALDGHADWPTRYPMQAWNPQRDLAFYLQNVWEVLNADDYLGI